MGKQDKVENLLFWQLLQAYPWVEDMLKENPQFGDMLLFLIEKVYKHAIMNADASMKKIINQSASKNE